MDLGLKDKVVIVTGSGSGIGQGIALGFAKEGAKVAVGDISMDNAQATVKLIEEAGGTAWPCTVDVSKKASVAAMFEGTLNHFGRFDILVTAAGINEGGPVDEVSEESWNRIIGVNLSGTYFCIQEAIKIFKKREDGKGTIVTIASETAKRGAGRKGGGGTQYAASKGGVLALSKTVAKEMRSYPGFYINCVCPGPTDTPMLSRWTEETRKTVANEILKGRFAKPEEIANAVVFMASERASFIYGESLNVDGGIVLE